MYLYFSRYFVHNNSLEMLLKEQIQVKFKKPMQKILCASTAYNGTFVVVRLDKPCAEQSIVHLNVKGQILFQHTYEHIIDFFGMMSDKQVIVLNVPENKIDLINLEAKTISQANHQYHFENTASMEIYTFSQSRLFAIIERGTANDSRLFIAYYQYDQFLTRQEPYKVWQSANNEWTTESSCISKLNNHSKIGWWGSKHQKSVSFSFVDLNNHEKKVQFSRVKAVSQQDKQYGVDGILFCISSLWQIKKNRYMLVAISNKYQYKGKCCDKNGVINNNFIIDFIPGEEEASMRETKFVFEVDKDFMYNDQVTDCFSFGPISVFHTFRHENRQVLQTPLYFVSNEEEKIVSRQTWKSSCETSNYFFPGWDNSFVRATHTNGDCENCIFSVRKVMEYKQIVLHFLLHLNEDFDDDLLFDAIELLKP